MKKKLAVLILFSVMIFAGLFSCGRSPQDTINGFVGSMNAGTDPQMYLSPSCNDYATVTSSWLTTAFPDSPYTVNFVSSTADSETVTLYNNAAIPANYYFLFVRDGMDSYILEMRRDSSGGTVVID